MKFLQQKHQSSVLAATTSYWQLLQSVVLGSV